MWNSTFFACVFSCYFLLKNVQFYHRTYIFIKGVDCYLNFLDI